jgi:hypothetical protein
MVHNVVALASVSDNEAVFVDFQRKTTKKRKHRSGSANSCIESTVLVQPIPLTLTVLPEYSRILYSTLVPGMHTSWLRRVLGASYR